MIKNFLKMFALSIMLGCPIEGMESQQGMQKVGGLIRVRASYPERGLEPKADSKPGTVSMAQFYKMNNKEYASDPDEKKNCFLFGISINRDEFYKQLFLNNEKGWKKFEEEMTKFDEEMWTKYKNEVNDNSYNEGFFNKNAHEKFESFVTTPSLCGKFKYENSPIDCQNKAFDCIVDSKGECKVLIDFLNTNTSREASHHQNHEVREIQGNIERHFCELEMKKTILRWKHSSDIKYLVTQYIFPGDTSELCAKKCEFGLLKNASVANSLGTVDTEIENFIKKVECDIENRKNDIQKEIQNDIIAGCVTSEKRACKKCREDIPQKNVASVNANRIQGNSEEESKELFAGVTVQEIKK